jgi:hypothetical protein
MNTKIFVGHVFQTSNACIFHIKTIVIGATDALNATTIRIAKTNIVISFTRLVLKVTIILESVYIVMLIINVLMGGALLTIQYINVSNACKQVIATRKSVILRRMSSSLAKQTQIAKQNPYLDVLSG